MTVNSTTSELMQDNSSTECVSSETNPTTTVQSNELIFGQKHNISRLQDFANVNIPTESVGDGRNEEQSLERDGKEVLGHSVGSGYDRKHRVESTRIERDSTLCFRPQVGESGNPRRQ